MTDPSAPLADFRFGAFERLGLALAAGLLWLMVLGLSGTAAALFFGGEALSALILVLTAGFIGVLAQVVTRDAAMKARWRIMLGSSEANLDLPAGRLLFGPAEPFTGALAYHEIAQLEWREEAITSLGLVTINKVYAARLHDGRLLLLGEDRPIPRTMLWTTRTGETASALAAAASVQMKQLGRVRGSGGVLTLWGAKRPGWPRSETGGLSARTKQALCRRLILTNMIPLAAFALVLIVMAISGISR
jgi:hypothetical protein